MQNSPLFIAVDEILCYLWDPIGVSSDGTPQTRDEYTSYVPEIVKLLEDGADAQQIADNLDRIEVEQMGLDSDKGRNRGISELLIDKYRFLVERSR
jgi:hypothetical protein